jgi:F0F1-type ATP synthase membrane subunit b/b'
VLELNATIAVIMVLFAGLAWVVGRMYLRPIGTVLDERHQATEGTIEEARQKMARVEEDLRLYRHQIRQAQAENYRHQEELRRQVLEMRQQLLHQGHKKYEEVLAKARVEIAEQTARAKEWISHEAEELSNQLVKKLLA